jgi:hypothetical protein
LSFCGAPRANADRSALLIRKTDKSAACGLISKLDGG